MSNYPIFRGQYTVRLDSHLRLQIPAEVCRLIGGSDTDMYLRVLSPGVIKVFAGRHFQGMLELCDAATRGSAVGGFRCVTRDTRGRSVLPRELLEEAGIHASCGEMAILGIHDHLELMTSEHWAAHRAALLRSIKEIALANRRSRAI